MSKPSHTLDIPLFKNRGDDHPNVPGYEKELRPRPLTLKVFLKLVGRARTARTEHLEALDKQMFGQPNEYDSDGWARIVELEERSLRLQGAVAAFRWILGFSDAIALDIESVMTVDLNALDRPE